MRSRLGTAVEAKHGYWDICNSPRQRYGIEVREVSAARVSEMYQPYAESPAKVAYGSGKHDRPPAMVDLHDVEAVIVGKPLDAQDIFGTSAVLGGEMLAADVVQALSAEMRKAKGLR
jgi:hypothetical protein